MSCNYRPANDLVETVNVHVKCVWLYLPIKNQSVYGWSVGWGVGDWKWGAKAWGIKWPIFAHSTKCGVIT